MKKLTTLSILISSVIGFNAMASSIDSTDKTHAMPKMTAEIALGQIKTMKPADYDSIELVEKEDGSYIYIATPKSQTVQEAVFLDATSGKDVTQTIQKVNFSLQEVLAQVGKTHQGLIVSAHSDLVPELGTIYMVELKESYDEPLSTLLVIDAKTLKVIDTEKVDMQEMFFNDEGNVEFEFGMYEENFYDNAHSINAANDLELLEVGPQQQS